MLGTLALFGASLLVIKKVVPNYCIMDKLDAKKNPKKKHMFTAAFVVSRLGWGGVVSCCVGWGGVRWGF